MITTYTHNCGVCGKPSFSYRDDGSKIHNCEQEYFWVCDNCGVQVEIKFHDEGRGINQKPTGRRCENTLALLTCVSSDLALIVDGCHWLDLGGNNQYYFGEGTCPSNTFRACDEVIYKGEVDPHGIFQYHEEFIVTGPDAINEEDAKMRLIDKAISITRGKKC